MFSSAVSAGRLSENSGRRIGGTDGRTDVRSSLARATRAEPSPRGVAYEPLCPVPRSMHAGTSTLLITQSQSYSRPLDKNLHHQTLIAHPPPTRHPLLVCSFTSTMLSFTLPKIVSMALSLVLMVQGTYLIFLSFRSFAEMRKLTTVTSRHQSPSLRRVSRRPEYLLWPYVYANLTKPSDSSPTPQQTSRLVGRAHPVSIPSRARPSHAFLTLTRHHSSPPIGLAL